MKLSITPLLALGLLSTSVSANEVTASDHLVSKTEKVMYSCTVSSSWSSANHPVDYPSNAHNSPPVLVAHNANYKMFTPGSPVGEGVKIVAETGDPTKLGEELVATGSDVMSYIVGVPMFFEPQPTESRRLGEARLLLEEEGAKGGDPITAREQTLPTKLVFTPEHTMFTAISMLAPSPDWFTSSHGTEPTLENGNGDMVWQKSFKIETLPYDAGTDSGVTFLSNDTATVPAEGSAMFTTETSDIGIFVNEAGDSIEPVMAWACSIDSVIYKCEFDENCKEGVDNDVSAAVSGKGLILGGGALASLVAFLL